MWFDSQGCKISLSGEPKTDQTAWMHWGFESSLDVRFRRYVFFCRGSNQYFTAKCKHYLVGNKSISIYSIHYSVGNNYINSIAVITLSIWDRQDCANSIDPDQTPQNAASDQGLSC